MTTCPEHQWNQPCMSCLDDGRDDYQRMANRAEMGRTFGSLARRVAQKMRQQEATTGKALHRAISPTALLPRTVRQGRN